MTSRIRILIARLGMDAHWRGSIVVARALRDAGMEVIYVGNQMPPNIVKMADQEDVDFIGLSSLSGNHLELAPKVVELLREQNLDHIKVIFGGTVAPDDVAALKQAGIHEIFGPGTPISSIVDYILRSGPAAESG
ncbi:MAG: cobalamin B12-binding domain-containing protein [Syntrophales bacterium]|nr:cobalamin B12-binding domain-containing protein [Syntrophales bacterium]